MRSVDNLACGRFLTSRHPCLLLLYVLNGFSIRRTGKNNSEAQENHVQAHPVSFDSARKSEPFLEFWAQRRAGAIHLQATCTLQARLEKMASITKIERTLLLIA